MKIGFLDNIKELAPTLSTNFVDEEENFHAKFHQIHKEYQQKIEKIKQKMGIGAKYFLGHLHDSKILSSKIKDNNLSLILNDMATLQFACALIDKMGLKINKSKMKFPLEIKTKETTHLSLNIVDDNGKIFGNEFFKLKEYLYEEIIAWTDENIEIAFDLWDTKKMPTPRYLLLVACKKIEFIEGQDKYWKKYFGDKYNSYYQYFLNERNNGEYLSDYSLCKQFIDKIK